MLWIKQNGRLLLCSALALLLGLGAGLLIPIPAREAQPPAPAAEPVGRTGGPSILPDTTVQVDYTFLLCGHTLTRDETGGALTGCNLEQVNALWPDARVIALESGLAHIAREVAAYCPQHYLLFLDDAGGLCVSHTQEDDPTQQSVTALRYDTAALPEGVRARLKDGLAFDSLEQINAYLEDVES